MEVLPAYGTAAVIILVFLAHLVSRRFDPFALHLDVSCRIRPGLCVPGDQLPRLGHRGPGASNRHDGQCPGPLGGWSGSWSSIHCGLSKQIAKVMPKPPTRWSVGIVCAMVPVLVAWGAVGRDCCSVAAAVKSPPKGLLLASFPFVNRWSRPFS